MEEKGEAVSRSQQTHCSEELSDTDSQIGTDVPLLGVIWGGLCVCARLPSHTNKVHRITAFYRDTERIKDNE